MSNTLLAKCQKRGIRLSVEGETLQARAPKGVITPELKEQLKAHKPELMQELVDRSQLDDFLAKVCNDIDGITPQQFQALCASADIQDILPGKISLECLRAYAQSFAGGIKSGRILFHSKSGALVRHGLT